MRSLVLVAALLALTGCNAVGRLFTPDPKPAQNLAHVERLVAKDPDPADMTANSEAVYIARGIADDAEAATIPAMLSRIGEAATPGIPWTPILAAVGTLGALFTGGKSVRRKMMAKKEPAPKA